MSYFDQVKKQKANLFKRETGLSLRNFKQLLGKVQGYLAQEAEDDPLHRRGQKSEFPLEDRLLLTLFYLRHYPTFLNLGKQFGLSESYAHKIYHRVSGILLKVSRLKSRRELSGADLRGVVIDVTEQPIERPHREQKAFYSGKKNVIPLKSNW